MAHYGDPEAHRCILEEVSASPAAPRLLAYLKAAVMGSQGSEVGLQLLRRFPGAYEQPGPQLEVPLALLSLTVLAGKAHSGFRAEQQRVAELLAHRRATLLQQAEQLKKSRAGSVGSSGGAGPSPFTTSSGVGAFAVPLSSLGDTSGASSGPANTVAAAGSAEESLTPAQRWEQAMDTLNYCEAYANYLHGFTVLWYELFGPNYYYADTTPTGPGEGDAEDGDGNAAASSPWMRQPECGEWASPRSPLFPLSPIAAQQARRRQQHRLCGPQVPPHLYAVRWRDILTPQRRAWFVGLHSVVKELLVRILHRELPVELYVLFIQYANLSLRVYLLQTLAEVFEWTSHCVDVIYYVYVMRQSYSIQSEMSQLQRVWSSFGLYDSRFLADCREFNKVYTESQGAFSEQRVAEQRGPAAAAAAAPSTLPPAAPSRVGNAAPRFAHSAASGAGAGHAAAVANGQSLAATADRTLVQRSFSGTGSSTSPGTSSSISPTAAASGPTTPPPQSDTPASPSAVQRTQAGGSGTAPAGATTALARAPRMLPEREAAGNTSSDAADAVPSSASSTPEEEALSSASESGAAETKRAVYLPLFYTCCCFTWILQRTFWSMYGRCALLFESCLGIEVAPQVAFVDGAGEVDGGGAPVLFTTAQLGTRRRGFGSAALTSGSPSLVASPSSPLPRADGGPSLGAAAAVVGAPAPVSRPPSASSMSVTTTRNNVVTGHRSGPESPQPAAGRDATTPSSGRPPQPPRQSPPPDTASASSTGPTQPSAPEWQSPFAASLCCTAQRVPGAAAEGEAAPPASATPGGVAGASTRASPGATTAAAATAPVQSLTARRDAGTTLSSWGGALSRWVPYGPHRRHGRSPPPADVDVAGAAALQPAAAASDVQALAAALPPSVIADPAASLLVLNSGAPFYLQYTHRAREVRLYEDPSARFQCGGGDGEGEADGALYFEEFHFLRETGCYVLSHALRSLTCYPRYPATLLILVDNTNRPGRVSWCDHKFSVLSSSTEEGDERRGLTPWVLSAVIPHTRLSAIRSVRARQEETLLEHIVFQVAGAKSERVRFCASNAVLFVLNSGREMDGGRLYFALHLHVAATTQQVSQAALEAVMTAESQWAFRALGELHVGWAMSCTCNEALRVAFQIGPGETLS